MSIEEEFLSLLEKNKRFRLTVASYLGYKEILQRLSEHDEKFEDILEEVRALREGQNKLWEEVNYLRADVMSFGKAVGRTLEDYTAALVRLILEERGYSKEKLSVGRRTLVYEGKVIEINIFNEDPLVVGEVTTYVSEIDEARKEVNKVLERIKIAEKVSNRKTELALLAVANAPSDVINELRKLTKKHKITLVYGRKLI